MMVVFDFELLDPEIAEFVISAPFELLDDEITEMVTAVAFESMCGKGLPENDPVSASPLAVGWTTNPVLASNILFCPQNILHGKAMGQGSTTVAEAERLRDGTSMETCAFTNDTWVKWNLLNEPINFLAIFNSPYMSEFTYTIVTGANSYSGKFAGTNYGSYVILPYTFNPDYIMLTKPLIPGGHIGYCGEFFVGLWQQPTNSYCKEGFTFSPEVIGETQNSKFCARASDSYTRTRNFSMKFQLGSSTEVAWWEELLITAHKQKAFADGHYITYPIAVVVNSVVYLMTINRRFDIPQTQGDHYELTLELLGEGIRL